MASKKNQIPTDQQFLGQDVKELKGPTLPTKGSILSALLDKLSAARKQSERAVAKKVIVEECLSIWEANRIPTNRESATKNLRTLHREFEKMKGIYSRSNAVHRSSILAVFRRKCGLLFLTGAQNAAYAEKCPVQMRELIIKAKSENITIGKEEKKTWMRAQQSVDDASTDENNNADNLPPPVEPALQDGPPNLPQDQAAVYEEYKQLLIENDKLLKDYGVSSDEEEMTAARSGAERVGVEVDAKSAERASESAVKRKRVVKAGLDASSSTYSSKHAEVNSGLAGANADETPASHGNSVECQQPARKRSRLDTPAKHDEGTATISSSDSSNSTSSSSTSTSRSAVCQELATKAPGLHAQTSKSTAPDEEEQMSSYGKASSLIRSTSQKLQPHHAAETPMKTEAGVEEESIDEVAGGETTSNGTEPSNSSGDDDDSEAALLRRIEKEIGEAEELPKCIDDELKLGALEEQMMAGGSAAEKRGTGIDAKSPEKAESIEEKTKPAVEANLTERTNLVVASSASSTKSAEKQARGLDDFTDAETPANQRDSVNCPEPATKAVAHDVPTSTSTAHDEELTSALDEASSVSRTTTPKLQPRHDAETPTKTEAGVEEESIDEVAGGETTCNNGTEPSKQAEPSNSFEELMKRIDEELEALDKEWTPGGSAAEQKETEVDARPSEKAESTEEKTEPAAEAKLMESANLAVASSAFSTKHAEKRARSLEELTDAESSANHGDTLDCTGPPKKRLRIELPAEHDDEQSHEEVSTGGSPFVAEVTGFNSSSSSNNISSSSSSHNNISSSIISSSSNNNNISSSSSHNDISSSISSISSDRSTDYRKLATKAAGPDAQTSTSTAHNEKEQTSSLDEAPSVSRTTTPKMQPRHAAETDPRQEALLQAMHAYSSEPEKFHALLRRAGWPPQSAWSDYELLEAAIGFEYKAIAVVLLEQGARVSKDGDGPKAFHDVVRLNWLDVVQLFLDRDARVFEQDLAGNTALHQAFLHKTSDAMMEVLGRRLVERTSHEIVNSEGLSTFHLLCGPGSNGELVKAVLARGYVDVSSRVPLTSPHTSRGYTALHFAVENNRMETAKVLLDHQANLLYAHDSTRTTPLHLAGKLGLTEMIDLLLAYDRFNDDLEDDHVKDFLSTVESQPWLSAEAMTESRVKEGPLTGCSPLMLADRCGRRETVDLLITRRLPPCDFDAAGPAPTANCVVAYRVYPEDLPDADSPESPRTYLDL